VSKDPTYEKNIHVPLTAAFLGDDRRYLLLYGEECMPTNTIHCNDVDKTMTSIGEFVTL
jgi:hypothetical protein